MRYWRPICAPETIRTRCGLLAKGPNAFVFQPAPVVWIVVEVTTEAFAAKSGGLLKGSDKALTVLCDTATVLNPTGLVATVCALRIFPRRRPHAITAVRESDRFMAVSGTL